MRLQSTNGGSMSDSKIRGVIEAFRETDQQERERNERAFEEMLRGYILNERPYLFGGVTNLLGSIADICETLHLEQDCDDYDKAAILINACADATDLAYINQRE